MMFKFDLDQTNSHRVINKRFGVEECWSYISFLSLSKPHQYLKGRFNHSIELNTTMLDCIQDAYMHHRYNNGLRSITHPYLPTYSVYTGTTQYMHLLHKQERQVHSKTKRNMEE